MAATKTSAPQKRPGGRSARVRAAVLKATLEELAEGDYASFSLEGVARRAGVNKTTVYRRWGTRETLILDAMLERGSERVPIPDTGSLEEDLYRYAKAIADNATDADVQAIVRAVASIGDPDSQLVEASRSFWQTRLKLARAMIERAAERGEIPGDMDASLLVESVIAPIYFRLLMSRKKASVRYLKALAAAVARSAGAAPRRP